MSDIFNQPGADAGRFTTMSLQSTGASTIPNHSLTTRPLSLTGHGTNYTGDIPGSSPSRKMDRFTSKPDLYSVADIKGTMPSQLHRRTNSVDYTLKCDDIAGSQARGTNHPQARSANPVDPLTPQYKLPSYERPAEVQPKFLRDTLDITDIGGTRARPLYKYPTRENFKVDDIEGARAGWKPRHMRVGHEGTPRDIMRVADINDQGEVKRDRCTDPLRPVHYINGMTVMDDMKMTMPRRMPPERDGPFFPLTTKDIEGAWPGWTPPHEMQPPLEQRRHFRNTNFVGDIAGAQSDTVMHCIKTNRVTNPLNPNYTSLDGDSLNPTARKTPAALDAEAALNYAMDNSGRQEQEYKSARSSARQQQLTNTAELRDITPRSARRRDSPQVPQTDTMDARDARIRQLETEVQELRTTSTLGGEGLGKPPMRQQPMEMSSGYRAPSPGGSSATQYRQPSPQPQEAFYGSRGPSPRGSARGASPALSTRSQQSNGGGRGGGGGGDGGGNGNGGFVLSSRSRSNSADRMILKSSDGAPRVNMTPREVKQARQYDADVAAVRDL